MRCLRTTDDGGGGGEDKDRTRSHEQSSISVTEYSRPIFRPFPVSKGVALQMRTQASFPVSIFVASAYQNPTFP